MRLKSFEEREVWLAGFRAAFVNGHTAFAERMKAGDQAVIEYRKGVKKS